MWISRKKLERRGLTIVNREFLLMLRSADNRASYEARQRWEESQQAQERQEAAFVEIERLTAERDALRDILRTRLATELEDAS